MFFLRIWGTRGSIACPGQKTAKFGGNTTCLEVRAGTSVFCVDFGTGVRGFGDYLLQHDIAKGLKALTFFVTHSHWDHIIGFPMFSPIYLNQIKMDIYSPYMINGKSLKQLLKTELSYEYWPVSLNELKADMRFHELRETELDFDCGMHVITKYLNHPVIDLGYRFEYKGKIIVIIHDSEPFFNQFYLPKKTSEINFFDEDACVEAGVTAAIENEKIIKFMENADVVIYDAQYTKKEYKMEKINWGHSSYESAIQNGIAAKVKRIILNHHDPARSDSVLLKYETKFKKQYASKIHVDMAREGMKLEL